MHNRLSSPSPARQSLLHRAPAAIKVMATLVLILSVVIISAFDPRATIPGLALVALILMGLLAISRISWLYFLRRLLLLEPFVLGVALMSLYQPGGWRVMLLVIVKCTLCLATTILLASTTPPSELVRLLKRLRAPSLLVTTLMLMYRYLFVLAEESQRMRRARASRSFSRRRWMHWKSLASVAGQLFIRASDRAERVYAAMCARGWQ